MKNLLNLTLRNLYVSTALLSLFFGLNACGQKATSTSEVKATCSAESQVINGQTFTRESPNTDG